MSQAINAEIAKLIGNVKIPRELTTLTSTLLVKADKIPMKPAEAPARMALCAHVAIEKKVIELELPAPKQTQPPVPPKTYEKLLQIFREELLGAPSAPSTPRKRKSPMKNPQLATPRTPRTPQTTSKLQRELLDTGRTDGNVIGEDLANSAPINGGGDDDGLLPETPTKKARVSPTKGIRRGGQKAIDPQQEDIEYVAKELRFPKHATEGVVQGYNFYWSLVKDRWGLLFGLLMTIAFHIQHKSFTATEAAQEAFKLRALQLTRRSALAEERVQEWITWTESILKDQMWLKIIEQKSGIAPGVIQRKLDRKTSKSSFSGIGNMIPSSFAFSSSRKKSDYHVWKESILSRVAELQNGGICKEEGQ